jgi:hypothetical protein
MLFRQGQSRPHAAIAILTTFAKCLASVQSWEPARCVDDLNEPRIGTSKVDASTLDDKVVLLQNKLEVDRRSRDVTSYSSGPADDQAEMFGVPVPNGLEITATNWYTPNAYTANAVNLAALSAADIENLQATSDVVEQMDKDMDMVEQNIQNNKEHPQNDGAEPEVSLEAVQRLGKDDEEILKELESKVECKDIPGYNQTCLIRNAYLRPDISDEITLLVMENSSLPQVMLSSWGGPDYPARVIIMRFHRAQDMRTHVDRLSTTRKPGLSLLFKALYHHNWAHAMFDGLYPAYVGLTKFGRHHDKFLPIVSFLPAQPATTDCKDFATKKKLLSCAMEDAWRLFGSKGDPEGELIRKRIAEPGDSYLHLDELIMGSGHSGEYVANLWLAGSQSATEYMPQDEDALVNFRDRIYEAHGVKPPRRRTSSNNGRDAARPLNVLITDNERSTPRLQSDLNSIAEWFNEDSDKQVAQQFDMKVGRGGCDDANLLQHGGSFTDEAHVHAMCLELNCASYSWSNDTNDALHGAWFCSKDTYDSVSNSAEFPLWKVGRRKTDDSFKDDVKRYGSMSVAFLAWEEFQPWEVQLKILRNTDVLVSGIGTALFYHLLLPDGSATINLGWNRPEKAWGGPPGGPTPNSGPPGIPTYGEEFLGMSNRRAKMIYMPLDQLARGPKASEIGRLLKKAEATIRGDFEIPVASPEENLGIYGKILAEVERRSWTSYLGLRGIDSAGNLLQVPEEIGCHTRASGQSAASDAVLEQSILQNVTLKCGVNVEMLRKVKAEYRLHEFYGTSHKCDCVACEKCGVVEKPLNISMIMAASGKITIIDRDAPGGYSAQGKQAMPLVHLLQLMQEDKPLESDSQGEYF